MPDAIEMLEVDHCKVDRLFERYQSSPDPKVVDDLAELPALGA